MPYSDVTEGRFGQPGDGQFSQPCGVSQSDGNAINSEGGSYHTIMLFTVH
jgi:hypothetical protein